MEIEPPFKPGWRRDDFPRNRPSMMAGRWNNRPPAHYDNPYDEGPPRFDERGPPPPSGDFDGPPYGSPSSLYFLGCYFHIIIMSLWPLLAMGASRSIFFPHQHVKGRITPTDLRMIWTRAVRLRLVITTVIHRTALPRHASMIDLRLPITSTREITETEVRALQALIFFSIGFMLASFCLCSKTLIALSSDRRSPGPPPPHEFPPPPYDVRMRDDYGGRDREFDPPPPPPYRESRNTPPRDYFPPGARRSGEDFDSRRDSYRSLAPSSYPPPPPPSYPPPPLPPSSNAPLPPPEPMPREPQGPCLLRYSLSLRALLAAGRKILLLVSSTFLLLTCRRGHV